MDTVELASLSESNGLYETYAAHMLLGHVWSKLKEYGCAAQSFYKARGIAGYSPYNPHDESFSTRLSGRFRDPELICELFNYQALAHAHDDDWGNAYMRASDAVRLVDAGYLPRFVNYGDCGSWVRLTRMVAATQYKPDDWTETAVSDANWFLKNSTVKGYSEIASAVIQNANDTRMPELVLAAWLAYDVPRRAIPIQFEDEAAQ